MSEDKDQEKKAAEDKADVEITEDSKEEPKETKPDKKALEKERKEIIQKMLRIQKEFMELERSKGVTEKDIHHNPQGIVKEYKEEHEKLANRLVDIAHALKGSIRT
tara:strand:+ start:917 stop:1234 length:318 start_codon:yes stop_codon:yes gene_type:complete